MLRKLLTIILLFGFSYLSFSQSQSGTLKGKVTENDSSEPIPMANIVIELNGVIVGGAVADFDGEYTIKPIDPGSYTVKVSFIGFASKEIRDVIVTSNKITFVNAGLKTESEVLGEVELVEYVVPLIDPDKSGTTKTKEEITALPTRNVQSVAAQTAGIYQEDEGSSLNVRGARSDATFYYIDGIKVRGSNSLPQSAIEQMTVITGGLPAAYGDATGGIISITTRGPSNEFFGGVEAVTSKLLDPYGYNLLGFNLSGPLLKKEDGNSILGFFLSGEYQSQDDGDPSAADIYKVKDNVLTELQENPLIFSIQNGLPQSKRASEFITLNDLEKIDVRQNVESRNARIQGKIDFKPSLNTNVTIGGNLTSNKGRGSVYTYSLFNPQNNPEFIDEDWRVYARFQQSFGSTDGEQSASAIKNAYFTLQADYSKDTYLEQDADHKDKLFNYGYVGRFSPIRELVKDTPSDWETNEVDSLGNLTYTLNIYNPSSGDTMYDVVMGYFNENGFVDSDFELGTEVITNYEFQSGGVNPFTENYTQSYFDFMNYNDLSISTLDQITSIGAAVNGDRTDDVYSIWFNTGREYNGYSKNNNSQFRFTGSASADINDHAIQFGFEYEQRDDRFYGVSPIGLWTLAEQKVNNYIQLNSGAYEFLLDQDPSGYLLGRQNLYNYDEMSSFAQNFRNSQGISFNQYVDIHTFNPNSLDIGMFSPDGLLNNGSNYASWYGYDYQGNLIDGVQPGMNEFLTDKDENGNYKREIGAFQPIYVAGYIQDKFAFKDLIFNIGVRVDRYDANQEVLKDPYSIYNVLTAGEVSQFGTHPSNIGSDYVVYVNDNSNPSSITGYRNGENWYDAEGLPINDPNILNVSKGVLPMLANPEALLDGDDALNKGLSADAFEDYIPQVTIMPRISFNFPISDQAMFYAYYDVLTQRPSGNRMNPLDYLFLAYKTTSSVFNPNLKPQKTTNYEIGFKQALSSSSALTINAFYREMRDMIQYTRIPYAFPIEYFTYGNIDFGTVKGLSLAYELRRTKNVTINANYTMQFADGSGSNATSGANIVTSEQPNLRTTLPLDYDQRHNITTVLDFRYGSGRSYNGPVVNGREILANMGVNLIATAGSGTPYSRQLNATREAMFGINNRAYLEGTINGSRLPWTYRLDLRLNKSFNIYWGNEDNKNSGLMNIYLQVQNILNTANIVNVYQFTGNPDDDGYLSTAVGVNDIQDQLSPASFADLYNVKLNNPSNFTRPRTIRLGLMFDF